MNSSVSRPDYRCIRCGYEWSLLESLRGKEPKLCPRCHMRTVTKIKYKGFLDYVKEPFIYATGIPSRAVLALRSNKEKIYKLKDYAFILDYVLFIVAIFIIIRVLFYFFYQIG